jgi:hypothetical protein
MHKNCGLICSFSIAWPHEIRAIGGPKHKIGDSIAGGIHYSARNTSKETQRRKHFRASWMIYKGGWSAVCSDFSANALPRQRSASFLPSDTAHSVGEPGKWPAVKFMNFCGSIKLSLAKYFAISI